MNVGLMPDDVIAGTAVIMGAVNEDGQWTDIPQDLIDEIRQIASLAAR
jgi:hypothetical protein